MRLFCEFWWSMLVVRYVPMLANVVHAVASVEEDIGNEDKIDKFRRISSSEGRCLLSFVRVIMYQKP